MKRSRTPHKQPTKGEQPNENLRTLANRLLPTSSVSSLLQDVPAILERRKNQYLPAVTRRKQADFLRLLAHSGQHTACCAAVGVATSTPFGWADRSADFAKKYEVAKKAGENALLAAYEQDLDNVVAQPAFLPYTANLRMFRMKRLDPRYRDGQQVNVAVLGPAAIMLGVDDDQAQPKRIEKASSG